MEAAQTSYPSYLRPAALAALLLLELLALNLSFDSWKVHLLNSEQWFHALAYAGQFSKALVVVPVFLLLSLWPRLPAYCTSLQDSISTHPWFFLLALQVACYSLLYWLSYLVFSPEDGAILGHPLTVGWLLSVIATSVLWVFSVAPWVFWRRFLVDESKVLLSAAALGVLAWLLALYAQLLWTPLSEATFHLSASLLGLIYPDIVVDPEFRRLGAKDFIVNIAPQCSGYEGMGLMLAFTGFYLSIFRNDFRFPQALLLIPIGIAVIWLFNNFRIAALVAIGISFSPAVAVGGFHSQAGWISFIAVIILTLALAYRVPFFLKQAPPQAEKGQGINLPMATLIPFIVLLAATILTSALAADFDWFYPLRVAAVGLAIGLCWRIYSITSFKVGREAWIAGAAVFALWIAIVPRNPEADALFAANLEQTSQTAMLAWLLFRSLGAIITVPIAEELVFRGYLLSRLARQPLVLQQRLAFAWLPYLASSLLFGLLHGDWIAGIAAGLVYGLVRYRSNSIVDAMVAHALTNLLLTIYVIYTGQWSLW